jgi:lipopolysaccharide biosynthesis glycosyltransferase
MAPRTLVIYAGDARYAYPMLVSAWSVRAHASTDAFDIRIFAADYTPAQFDAAAAIAETLRVDFTPLNAADYLRFDLARFNTHRDFAHLKPAVLSRLVTGYAIPDRYDQVLYLDGDTYCTGDIAPLVAFPAPKGRLFGVADSVNYFKHDPGRYAAWWRGLMGSLDIPTDATWYNTGVMMAERETWAERGAAALAFFEENVERCKFPVDCATNATAAAHWAPMSCRWNFMAPMRMWRLDASIQPRLYHFTGKEKPWLGRMDPWRDFWPRYEAKRLERPLGALAEAGIAGAEIAAVNRHHAMEALKGMTVHRHRAHLARKAVMESEKSALV